MTEDGAADGAAASEGEGVGVGVGVGEDEAGLEAEAEAAVALIVLPAPMALRANCRRFDDRGVGGVLEVSRVLYARVPVDGVIWHGAEVPGPREDH